MIWKKIGLEVEKIIFQIKVTSRFQDNLARQGYVDQFH